MQNRGAVDREPGTARRAPSRNLGRVKPSIFVNVGGSRRARLLPAAAALALLVVGMVATAPAVQLVVTDDDSGRLVLCRPIATGDRVVLAFTHSMYGGDVREEYAPTRDGRLRRIAMTTENAAAAEYYAHTADVVRAGNRLRIDLAREAFAAIVVRVDRVGDHRLVIGGSTIDLVATAGDRRPVRLAVRPVGLAHRLLGQVLGRSC